MEAMELFHGEGIAERTRLASVTEMARHGCVVEPATLSGTGTPLPEDTRIPWIEGYDLLGRQSCWVPWEIVHTDYTLPTCHSGLHFLSGTNGLAAGNHLLEAVGAAICELIEHDAVALWHARRLHERARCRLDVASVDDADCCALLEKYRLAGVAPRLWDVASDIGVAAFVCDIPAAAEGPEGGLRRFRGAGCHANRGIALARALTEAAQIRLTYITGNRDDLPPSDYQESAADKLGAALLDAVSLDAQPRAFPHTPSVDADDLAEDVHWLLRRLSLVGIDRVIAVDLTRADIGIPVVRVVIPGLEWDCTHPGYAPGVRARRAGNP
jgi:ribosomal protein S12 methylthiotransferase accessory factor